MYSCRQKYQIVFLVTCIDANNILNCVQSITRNNHSLKCLVLVLLQNEILLYLKEEQTAWTEIKTYNIKNILPLSQARNFLFNVEEIYKDAYYMFPDDDSLFDEHFFSSFSTLVHGNTLIAVKGAQDSSKYFLRQSNKYCLSIGDYVKAISVNMIIKGETILGVGDFDENLGVGNFYGAGEDNDYFIRCCKLYNFSSINSLWNYHPLPCLNDNQSLKKLANKYISYGRGVVYMLLKHGLWVRALWVVVRGYLGCVKNLFSFHWKMAFVYFMSANTRCVLFIKIIIKSIFK